MTWPTLRLLSSLKSGWTNKEHEAVVARKAWGELPVFSKIGHPAVHACRDFDEYPSNSKYEEHKGSSREAGYKVVEARDTTKGPAWRTAILRKFDASWAVFADAHDKFHASAPAAFKTRKAHLEPTSHDVAIRKIKLAEDQENLIIEAWQRDMVRAVLDLFRDAYILEGAEGGNVVGVLPEPPSALLPEGISSLGAAITLTVMRYAGEDTSFDDAHEAEAELVELGLSLAPWKMDEQLKDLILNTVLPVIDPDEEKWAKDAGYYGKNGDLCFAYSISVARASQLIYSAESEEPVGEAPREPQKTRHAHYVDGSEIAASVVDRRAIRATCGFWFVTSRTPEGFPICPECIEALPEASAVRTFLSQRGSRRA